MNRKPTRHRASPVTTNQNTDIFSKTPVFTGQKLNIGIFKCHHRIRRIKLVLVDIFITFCMLVDFGQNFQ